MNRLSPPESDACDPVEPGCGATLERLQRVLDRELAPESLDADPHASACSTCRERIRAAHVLLCCVVPVPVTIPTEFATSIVLAVRADHRATVRRRILAATGGLAIAASLAVAVWLRWPTPQSVKQPQGETVQAPMPPLAIETPPLPPPVRLSDQLARAADAFRESTRPITEPTTGAPNVLDVLVSNLMRAITPPGNKFDPARITLAELPEAARVGFEPVTGTATKGFNRLLRDLSAIQPGGSN